MWSYRHLFFNSCRVGFLRVRHSDLFLNAKNLKRIRIKRKRTLGFFKAVRKWNKRNCGKQVISIDLSMNGWEMWTKTNHPPQKSRRTVQQTFSPASTGRNSHTYSVLQTNIHIYTRIWFETMLREWTEKGKFESSAYTCVTWPEVLWFFFFSR